MKHKLFLPVILLVALAGGVTLLLGCKQGEGERCQVNDDCASGLTCNQGTVPPSCQSTQNANAIDATVPEADIDAPSDAVDAPLG